MDPDTGAPMDTLTEPTQAWAESIGSKSKTVPEVLNSHDPAVSILYSRGGILLR